MTGFAAWGAGLGSVHDPGRILQQPTSPANAGAQIHLGRLGMMRRHAALIGQRLAGSIWIPAFAGKVGFWRKAAGSSRPILAPSAPSALLPRRGKKEREPSAPSGGGRPCEAWSGGGLRRVRLPPNSDVRGVGLAASDFVVSPSQRNRDQVAIRCSGPQQCSRIGYVLRPLP